MDRMRCHEHLHLILSPSKGDSPFKEENDPVSLECRYQVFLEGVQSEGDGLVISYIHKYESKSGKDRGTHARARFSLRWMLQA